MLCTGRTLKLSNRTGATAGDRGLSRVSARASWAHGRIIETELGRGGALRLAVGDQIAVTGTASGFAAGVELSGDGRGT
jgi:hypothetical protein